MAVSSVALVSAEPIGSMEEPDKVAASLLSSLAASGCTRSEPLTKGVHNGKQAELDADQAGAASVNSSVQEQLVDCNKSVSGTGSSPNATMTTNDGETQTARNDSECTPAKRARRGNSATEKDLPWSAITVECIVDEKKQIVTVGHSGFKDGRKVHRCSDCNKNFPSVSKVAFTALISLLMRGSLCDIVECILGTNHLRANIAPQG